jgi:hypothetical protein
MRKSKIKSTESLSASFQPKLWVRVHRNVEGEKEYLPMCTIGVQTFTFGRPCETKEEAVWYLGCMNTALGNAKKSPKQPRIYTRPLKRLSLNNGKERRNQRG